MSGRYAKKAESEGRKPLSVGISDYVRAQSEYYYVDKTMLVKEFLDRKAYVSLFTRPGCFGKTLNMDMLRVFFEISDEIQKSTSRIRLYVNDEIIQWIQDIKQRFCNSQIHDVRLSYRRKYNGFFIEFVVYEK